MRTFSRTHLGECVLLQVHRNYLISKEMQRYCERLLKELEDELERYGKKGSEVATRLTAHISKVRAFAAKERCTIAQIRTLRTEYEEIKKLLA